MQWLVTFANICTIPTLGTAIKDRKKYRGNKTVTWVISKSFYGHHVCCEQSKDLFVDMNGTLKLSYTKYIGEIQKPV